IARRLELTCDPDDTIVLGGNFFSSREFPETRNISYIVRTIVYHLALKCKAFADALHRFGELDAMDQEPGVQLEKLLAKPWNASKSESTKARRYLVMIDALDETGPSDGPRFLKSLLIFIDKTPLSGLKFFVTSREEPDLVELVNSLEQKHVYHLQNVEKEEVKADITTYLKVNLSRLDGSEEFESLRTYAGDLFICAATIVRYLKSFSRTPALQKQQVLKLVSNSAMPSEAMDSMDQLYSQIISEAFSFIKKDSELLAQYLTNLHTFLSTVVRTRPSIVARLLIDKGDLDSASTEVADHVVLLLHPVLYTDIDGNVLSYHKSFSDFIFDKNRSGDFYCDQPVLHRRLTESCFRIMNSGLKFNIAKIPSSFVFDSNNPSLKGEVAKNIPPYLAYSCQNWSQHLEATEATTAEPFPRMLSDFLQVHVLFWIEAMNLLGSSNRCDPMLQMARRWITKATNHDLILAQKLSESASFALYFSASPASLSTPHLYISALATWAKPSGLYRHWRVQFPKIPDFNIRGSQNPALKKIEVGSAVLAVGFSSDGTRIVSGSEDKSVRVWDASTGEMLKELEGHTGSVFSVGFSHDGTRIISGSADESVRVWDASTGQMLKKLEGHTGSVLSVGFSRDETRIVSGSHDESSVRVWDASTGQMLKKLEGHTGSVWSVGFSRDGTRIVSGSADESVQVWDASAGEMLKKLEGHTGSVLSVGFSRDGTRIVSGSRDESVRVWDAWTGEMLKKLKGYTNDVFSVAFSSDGTRIVSGSGDGSVRVWDASTGEMLKKLEGHIDRVFSVASSSDGTRIVLGSLDQSVRVWTPESLYTMEMTSTAQPSQPTGWLLSPHQREYLMYVPPEAKLPRPPTILIISQSPSSSVRLTLDTMGDQWHQCHSPCRTF
ncbi:WD40 repeat-like protein, partial [Coprinopsis marcescibilis]